MTTVSEKNRERILEAIDQLRHRKARPDIQRICNYLFRKFSINSSEAKADLNWCVDNGIVRKVEYKGSISYRNASKKFAPPNKRDCQRDNKNSNDSRNKNKVNRKFTQLLTNAFGELFVHEPDYLELGVPATEIIANILSKDSVRYTKKYISILLEKEVLSRGLIKMENGNFLMGPATNNDKEKKPTSVWQHSQLSSTDVSEIDPNANEAMDSDNERPDYVIQLKPRKRPGPKPGSRKDKFDNMDEDDKKSDNGILRVGGRRKRAKKVFDPSDTHIPKKRGRPAGSLNKSTIERQLARRRSSDEYRPDSRTSSNGRDKEQGGACSVCHSHSKKSPNERMVACRECSNKAHYACLNNGEDMMLKMYQDNTWQCPQCKTCVVCFETSDSGSLTVCSVCADGYHCTCHQPRISDKHKNSPHWLCINCQMPDDLKVNEIQSSIGSNSINIKSSNSNDGNDNSSGSNSGNSTPSNYRSPPLSPTPPQLSPQTALPDSPERGGNSDSQSNKDSEDNNKDFDDSVDNSIPDASNWTSEEVYQYFAQYFPEEARIFKEQEIDGRSLLLLRRIDVLTTLNLKLGPALKIYRHVVKLQVRRDDPKLYWL